MCCWSDRHAWNWHLVFYFSLKVEYDKLANEKTEMQRHYVMVRLYYSREQLWSQIARLVQDLVGVEWDRLLWSPCVVVVRAGWVSGTGLWKPPGGFDVAGCYGGALPDRQAAVGWGSIIVCPWSPRVDSSVALCVCWSDYSPRRLHAQTYAWP